MDKIEEPKQENVYMYQIAKFMRESYDRLERKLDSNTELTEKVLVQATKTNGRVTSLEEKVKDYPRIKEKVWWIIGIGSATVVMGGIIYAFVLQNISNEINAKFVDCCSSIVFQKNENN